MEVAFSVYGAKLPKRICSLPVSTLICAPFIPLHLIGKTNEALPVF